MAFENLKKAHDFISTIKFFKYSFLGLYIYSHPENLATSELVMLGPSNFSCMSCACDWRLGHANPQITGLV